MAALPWGLSITGTVTGLVLLAGWLLARYAARAQGEDCAEPEADEGTLPDLVAAAIADAERLTAADMAAQLDVATVDGAHDDDPAMTPERWAGELADLEEAYDLPAAIHDLPVVPGRTVPAPSTLKARTRAAWMRREDIDQQRAPRYGLESAEPTPGHILGGLLPDYRPEGMCLYPGVQRGQGRLWPRPERRS